MGEKISLREYARRVGVSAPAVVKAIGNGRITRGADMLIDWDVEGPKWGNRDIGSIRPHSYDKGQNQHKPEPQQIKEPPAKEPQADSSIPPTIETSYNKAKTVKETYSAKLRQVEYEKAIGKLVSKDDVKVSIYRFCRMVRDAIISIPDRVSAEVAARLMEYIKPVIMKHCPAETAQAIIQDIELQTIDVIVHNSWDKESRTVLENLSTGPKV